jgi:hypothetical protein
MRPFRLMIALLLATIWLPATLHCGLEAAGMLEHADACCHDEHAASKEPAHCGADNCGVVESGDYQPAHSLLKISAPVAVLDFSSLVEVLSPVVIEPEIVAPIEAESPLEIRRTWQFVARAAPSPRAPSFVA